MAGQPSEGAMIGTIIIVVAALIVAVVGSAWLVQVDEPARFRGERRRRVTR